jgi:hypothetical protein
MTTEWVVNEDLRAGDVVKLWCGSKTITSIAPYKGPLVDIIFAIASYVPGPTEGFSLERGGQTERYVTPPRSESVIP